MCCDACRLPWLATAAVICSAIRMPLTSLLPCLNGWTLTCIRIGFITARYVALLAAVVVAMSVSNSLLHHLLFAKEQETSQCIPREETVLPKTPSISASSSRKERIKAFRDAAVKMQEQKRKLRLFRGLCNATDGDLKFTIRHSQEKYRLDTAEKIERFRQAKIELSSK